MTHVTITCKCCFMQNTHVIVLTCNIIVRLYPLLSAVVILRRHLALLKDTLTQNCEFMNFLSSRNCIYSKLNQCDINTDFNMYMVDNLKTEEHKILLSPLKTWSYMYMIK